jgi:hypothetical protein
VLETGVGSGLNLPVYTGAVDQIIGLDPTRNYSHERSAVCRFTRIPLHLIRASAETTMLDKRPSAQQGSPE